MLWRTILLVEDDENDAVFLLRSFKAIRVGNPVHVVKDGREAMAYLSGTEPYANRAQYPLPYLILLDLKLPHVLGLDILKWVRQQPELDATIVLVLTASQDPADVQAAYHLRANAFLVKPSGLDQLQVLAQSIKDFWLGQNQAGAGFANQR